MTKIAIDGDELVVRLGRLEKAAARHGDIRVPVAAVEDVTFQPDAWRALRGTREHGVQVPGARWLGVWRHPGGRDFVAVRPKRRGVVCVDLRQPAPFARISATSENPQQSAAELREALSRAVAAQHRATAPEPEPEAEPETEPEAGSV
ncbi:hypothetical protein P3T36_006718 [Kitasatospora sp. MAP12-15]|uniref:hypothetical protein n=1 Tax=unclassified Kitasatospora TaxID=2633591 RepID=UPI002473729D|nr:hypothetical protein [Kitasatospora sp. MAP12-44]MDH6115308.1 hypothetical protein [Kitasatospora sp. MAP12-44]